MILVDLNHLSCRTFCVQWALKKQFDEDLFTHIFLRTLFSGVSKFLEEFGPEVILAVDSRCTWRKEIYKDYKGDRPGLRKDSGMDWDSFYRVYHEIVDILDQGLPFKVIQLEGVEADDVIGVLSHEFVEPTVIISSDKDFVQLLHSSHVRLFDPIKKEFRTSEDPLKDLFIKIMTGDLGDNIPSVKKGVGPKRSEKYWEDQEKLHEDGLFEAFQRNKKLIDLSEIPADVWKSIVYRYHECEHKKVCPTVVAALLSKHGCQKIAGKLGKLLG